MAEFEQNIANDGQVQLVRVDAIDDTGRLRKPDAFKVEFIASSMRKIGLRQPLDICQLPNLKSGRPYKLVAGGHRLAAARLNGDEYIKVIVGSNGKLECLEREITENIFRADLKPLERAVFVSRLYEIELIRRGLDPEKEINKKRAAVDKRWNKANAADTAEKISDVYGLTEAIAEKVGMTSRSVRLDLELLNIPSELLADFAPEDAIFENASILRILAKSRDPSEAANFVEKYKETGSLKAARDAHAVSNVNLNPSAKKIDAAMEFFAKLPINEKDDFLSKLAEQNLPLGWKVIFERHQK